MTKKRIATLATCLTLVGAVAIGGTLALLTSGVRDITNKFSVTAGYDEDGDKDFIIQEDIVTQDSTGNYIDDEEKGTTSTTQAYDNLVAGTTLHKNPYFTLRDAEKDPENDPPVSWVVARMSVADMEALNEKGITFTNVDDGTSWYFVTKSDETYAQGDAVTASGLANIANGTDETTAIDGYVYFIYGEKVSATDDGTDTSPLFTQLSVASTFDAKSMTNTLSLEIEGVAVQALDKATIANDINDIMQDAYNALNPQTPGTGE